ncbi:MAG: hypothetical protein OXC81_01710, partial [Betaproteobacteria bacterium]|nr:hypothetical protein [Betaproteobacteria bacterium]
NLPGSYQMDNLGESQQLPDFSGRMSGQQSFIIHLPEIRRELNPKRGESQNRIMVDINLGAADPTKPGLLGR